MASTYSTDLKLELMATGENAGTWGTKTNTNLNLIQQAIAGYQAIDVASGDIALAMTDASISNGRNMILKFTKKVQQLQPTQELIEYLATHLMIQDIITFVFQLRMLVVVVIL